MPSFYILHLCFLFCKPLWLRTQYFSSFLNNDQSPVSDRGNLLVRRQPLIPRILSVSDGAAVARKPFKPPCPKGYKNHNEELTRRLWARKRFVPWGSSRPSLVSISNLLHTPSVTNDDPSEKNQYLPPGFEPLVLWQSGGTDGGDDNFVQIEVDPLLVHYLRPHQRYCSCFSCKYVIFPFIFNCESFLFPVLSNQEAFSLLKYTSFIHIFLSTSKQPPQPRGLPHLMSVLCFLSQWLKTL